MLVVERRQTHDGLDAIGWKKTNQLGVIARNSAVLLVAESLRIEEDSERCQSSAT
jgi:hypothetical protein